MHTNNPGKALEYGLELGELVDLKIENILAERREAEAAKAAEEAAKNPPPVDVPEKEFGHGCGQHGGWVLTDLP